MKCTFVLDENVIICACTGKNERGENDNRAAELLVRIADNCHSISVSPWLIEAYWKKLSLREQSPGFDLVLRHLRLMMYDPVKSRHVSTAPEIQGEEALHQDDLPLVRLAASNQAIFVTTDDRLRAQLSQSGIPESYSFTVVRPEEALSFASADP